MKVPLLQVSNVDKSFSGVSVLRQIQLQVQTGQCLGLVGENGAGKSTLMNVLGGNLLPDAGHMTFCGKPYAPRSPRDAEKVGIAFIHQELNLFSNLSIAENLFLTRFPQRWGGISRKVMRQQADLLLARVGLSRSSDTLVQELTPGERQLVEIAKALSADARLMILDEPTTSLSIRESEKLFGLLNDLRSRGMSLIYISHAMQEIWKICSDIVVLRDGAIVGAGPLGNFDTAQIISLMVGRQVTQQFPPRTSRPESSVVLQVTNLGSDRIVRDVSFHLHRGEVLGISGLMGSGRTELARILFGLDSSTRGEVSIHGNGVTHASTRDRMRRGMAFVTESRRDDGLCLNRSVWENLALVAGRDFARAPFGFIRREALREAIRKTRQAVGLSLATRDDQAVQTLSGGNQQKVVLAKWLVTQPQLLILDEPTRGIDVGAKYEIYCLIDRLAAEGTGVLVISSEIDELIGLCDRILVLAHGTVTDEMVRAEFDRERIMRASLPATTEQGAR